VQNLDDIENIEKKFQDFISSMKVPAEELKSTSPSEAIRLISHLDADGISAASIIIRALNRMNRKYALSIVQQLDDSVAFSLSKEQYKTFIFTDIGSGQVSLLEKYLPEKRIFILDHHEIDRNAKENQNIFQINPHQFGIEGSTDISGAGVVFFFSQILDSRNEDMAHIALIGAIGDVQEEHGFSPINKKLVDIAEKNGRLKVTRGLKFFGAQTKPVHKLLEQSSDFFIPGVTGSESGSVQFLNSIGVNPRGADGSWRKLSALSEDEMKKLVAGIIIARNGEKTPDEVIGFVYTLVHEEENCPLKDAKEFSTLLNACGRMGKASFGIGACLGDCRAKQQALGTLADYKKEIMKSLRWYDENSNSKNVIRGNGYMIINAGPSVSTTIIGTMASIISKSNALPGGTIILSLAQGFDGKTKASIRVSGREKCHFDMRSVVENITRASGGEAGGHRNAAGAVMPTELEGKFIESARIILDKLAIEERVE
jgi:single-stranded-DNA-specific exonuclease